MNTPASVLHDISGGDALIEWFGRIPYFHDGELREITFSNKGVGLLRIYTWNMTDELNAEGYFVLEKHATVTIALEGVREINCSDFDMVPGIIGFLWITKPDDNYRIEWDASYGVTGVIIAQQLSIDLVPGKPK
jgi:hypothetical protein